MIALPLIPYMLLIGAAAQRDIAGDGTWFSRRTLVWAGTISYSFYLVHLLVIRGLETSHGPAFSPVWKLIALALAVLAASALYYVVERPADRWLRGVRFSRSRVEPRFEAAG